MNQPALTPDEWACGAMSRAWLEDGRVKVNGEDDGIYEGVDRHALAALALHGQPFGFTADLLKRLRHAPSLGQVSDDLFEISREDLRILLGARTEAANLIEALLPPEKP